jgi:exo-beta-1,3-glucanase (GH17 family)
MPPAYSRLVLALLLVPWCACAQPSCHRDAAVEPHLAALRTALARTRYIAYEPTALRVVDGRTTPADPASIRADLVALRAHFDGLITYEALHGTEALPAIAAALHFRSLIIGVWDPFDDAEVAAALTAARDHPALVHGISLGNELLFGRRRDAAALVARLREVRARAPGLPLSTSEPFHVYYDPAAAALLGEMDFMLANVHPVFQPWFRSAPDRNAAQFVVGVLDRLGSAYCGPVLVKETGVPTAPASAGFSAERQASFYGELRRQLPASRSRAFAYFAAFDAPWRVADWHPVAGAHPEEGHWGLYDAERRPKPVVETLPPLATGR